MGDPTPWVKGREAREVLCGKVLMIPGDYTNINFPGFIVMLEAVVGISACSHARRVKNIGIGVMERAMIVLWLARAGWCFKSKVMGTEGRGEGPE